MKDKITKKDKCFIIILIILFISIKSSLGNINGIYGLGISNTPYLISFFIIITLLLL